MKKDSNHNSLGGQLRRALASRDPFTIAACINLPPISSSNSSNKVKRTYKQESVQDSDGVEWGNVLLALQEATDAANNVSVIMFLVS